MAFKPHTFRKKATHLGAEFNVLQSDDIVISGRVGERSAERNKPLG